MDTNEVMNLIDKAADAIAEAQGMNVNYCESMDMDLFPVVVKVIGDDYDEDEIEGVLSDLRFLAMNGRLIPEELKDATYEEIQAYLIENKEEILEEIAGDCLWYIDEYSDCGEDDDDEFEEEEED